jgi:lambda repressor-like predicted transcriptional regulator
MSVAAAPKYHRRLRLAGGVLKAVLTRPYRETTEVIVTDTGQIVLRAAADEGRPDTSHRLQLAGGVLKAVLTRPLRETTEVIVDHAGRVVLRAAADDESPGPGDSYPAVG